MLKVFICDDEPKILADISAKVKSLSGDAAAEEFSGGRELLKTLSKESCQILLLDIDMPEIGGLEIAAKLTELNPKPLLIFVTSHDELVYDSLQYHPFGFVRKGHLDDELPKILTDCEKELNAKEKHFCFHADSSDYKLTLDEILYFESEGNYLKLFSKNGEYRFRETMTAVEKALSHNGFVRIHKGFLVNQAHVRILRADKTELNNGTLLPLGRSFADSAKRTLMRYMLK